MCLIRKYTVVLGKLQSFNIISHQGGKKYEKSKKISCIVNLLSVYEMADITFSRSSADHLAS